MGFNGNEGTTISRDAAGNMTETWRNNHSGARKALFFGRDKIEDILDQSDCKGLRIYFAQDENEAYELVVVGADSNEDDILDNILDQGIPCPSRCGASNDLNS